MAGLSPIADIRAIVSERPGSTLSGLSGWLICINDLRRFRDLEARGADWEHSATSKRRTGMNTHRHVLIGLIGAELLVSTPSYSRQDDQDDQDNKRPPAVSELYTPAMRNLGFIECIVVNIDTSPHNAQIEVFFTDGVAPGPIGGVLQPGGIWVINWALPDQFARGVARVFKGFPSDIRAMCTSKTSVDAPSGIAVQAE